MLASETTHVSKNATQKMHASPMLNIGARRRCVAAASPAQQRRTLAERQCERSLRMCKKRSALPKSISRRQKGGKISDLTCTSPGFRGPALSRRSEATSLQDPDATAILDPSLLQGGGEEATLHCQPEVLKSPTCRECRLPEEHMAEGSGPRTDQTVERMEIRVALTGVRVTDGEPCCTDRGQNEKKSENVCGMPVRKRGIREPVRHQQSFYQFINTCVDKLTFSILYDQKSISFLDTVVIINEDRTLSTDLYVKPTDKNSLLLFTSCHPRHIKRSLPKSQYSRINRIVSDPALRSVRLEEMTSKFRHRGYPDRLLDLSSGSSSSTTSQPKVNRIAFVNTYHPFMSMFQGLIRKHWPLLGTSYPNISEFQVAPLMCHKKPPNLRNLLVSADIGSSKLVTKQTFLATARKGTFPCLHCLQCSNITRGDTFTHPRSGKRFPIRVFFSCDSTYVIYLIKCPCGLGYVGETTQHIRDRISQHKSTIRCKKLLLPVPAHFIAHNHSISQLRYQVIDSVPLARRGGNRILKLKQKEAYWIHVLQTLEPFGLNREYETFY
ncbi:unnamed protein product [Ranitomeya imitator]|uniref:GIY-YIG domain-containing protein n=1 Tax=Ranitomeya imitator TaxID=111125 RepID=A0ABN9L263_9NEOB|nr:unnamed protein product [Ranitomeya imitator]